MESCAIETYIIIIIIIISLSSSFSLRLLILKSRGRLPGVLRARAEEHDSGAREAVVDVVGAGMLAAVPGHDVVPSRQLPHLHQPVRRLRGTATAPLPHGLHHRGRQHLQDEDVSVNDGRCVGFNHFTAPASKTYGRCVGFNPFTAPACITYGSCVGFNPFSAPACITYGRCVGFNPFTLPACTT